MGRGRAKAKQTKVARDLKYRTHETDFSKLAQELHGGDESLRGDTGNGGPPEEDNDDDGWPSSSSPRHD